MDKKRVLLLSDLHYCQEEYGGISRDEASPPFGTDPYGA